MRLFQLFALPATQILAAAIGLLAWLALGVTTAEYQALPIQVFATASVLALPLTLGLPYLLPNEFRGSDPATWSGRGAWSAVLAVALAAAGIGAFGGAIISFSGRLSGDVSASALYGAALSGGSLTACCILTAQMARIVDSLPKMAISTVGNLSTPLMWLLLSSTNMPSHEVAVWYSLFALSMVLVLIWGERGRLISPIRAVRSLGSATLRTAVILVPHLLLFAALIQGMRLATTLFQRTESLISAHYLMLLVSIGATLVGALHSILTVRIQAVSDTLLRAQGTRNAGVYGALGFVSSGFLLFASGGGFKLVVDEFPSLSRLDIAVFSSTLPSIVLYYALSGLLLRHGGTLVLLAGSSTALATFYALELWVGEISLSASIAAYSLSLLLLPMIAFSGLIVRFVRLRAIAARTVALASLGYAPSAIGVAAALLFP